MKKRVKKPATTSETLLDAAISKEKANEGIDEVKRGVKKTTKSKKTKSGSNDESSSLVELEVKDASVSVNSDRISPKRAKRTKKLAPEANVKRHSLLDEAKPAKNPKTTKQATVKTEKTTKKTASRPSVKTLNVKSSEDDSCSRQDSSRVETKGLKRRKKVAAKLEFDEKAATQKRVTKKKRVSPDAAVKSAEDIFELETSTTQTVDENTTANLNLTSVTIADNERNRRARNQEQKINAQNEDSESIGELPFWKPGWLVVQGAREHNLKSIDVPLPLSAFTVVTGVSGSGKSSLVEDVLYRYLARSLNRSQVPCGACDAIVGLERINKVVKVDQAPIGQTPTSNAATYTGAFDLIRQLFARVPEAKLRGYSPRRFSFNVPGGRCEKCEGAGMLKVEMHFLADVLITCDACGGKRYDSDTLQVKYRGKSIADVLETTCGEALEFFARFPPIVQILQTLCDVGLDYLPLGQPATTLSGGEAQRIKLATELSQIDSGRTLYILDEPTTGLHFEDVRKLLDVLHRLVDLGNTVVVVEHNLDVVKNADWVVEIGPEAGLEGGRLVFAGTPEQLIDYAVRWKKTSEKQRTLPRTYTGEALIPIFSNGCFEERPVLDPKKYWEELKNIGTLEDEDLVDISAQEVSEPPWEIDGRRWHTEFRTTRSGLPCKWEGQVLSVIVDRLEEKSLFAETDWKNRTCVEIRSEEKPNAWFMRAITDEEWLLRLKFRTAKNTFERGALTRKLALKPLKDMEEIPLYGTLPRVKVDVVGIWQEIELKVFSFSEIDRPEFWDFLELAVERYADVIERPKELDVDLTPWKTQGRAWHTSASGFYGSTNKALWPLELLEKTIGIVERLTKGIELVWTNKIAVSFYIKSGEIPLGKIYTKNSDFLCVQINFPQGEITSKQVTGIGFQPEIEQNELGIDALYLRFRTCEEFNSKVLQSLLKSAYVKNKQMEKER